MRIVHALNGASVSAPLNIFLETKGFIVETKNGPVAVAAFAAVLASTLIAQQR